MRAVTLTQIEVSGIQDYIFGSNNLKQNIGASELVTQATMDWVVAAFDELKISHNALWSDRFRSWQLKEWDSGLPEAQIVYWGGGNVLIVFNGPPEQDAHRFTQVLTREAVKKARGLSLVVGHQCLDWDHDSTAKNHQVLRKMVSVRKLSRLQDTPLLGLGVTAACVYTGLPAVALDEDSNPVSQAVRDKLNVRDQARGRLINLLRETIGNYEVVEDFNLLGERDESSYMAVIHADGNSMGKRFEAIAEKHPDARDNDPYCRQLRRLSEAIQQKAAGALEATVKLLVNSRHPNDKFGGEVPVPKAKDDNGREYLPFRPVVFGGDDVTFVSAGRLGLTLAAHYLRQVAQGNLPGARDGEQGDPLYARAGVAIVKTHYPFAQAYELADALCHSAKKKLKDLTPEGKGIIMDWHYATGGIILSLAQMRNREYSAQNGHNLLMRPVRLDLDPEKPPAGSRYWRSWHNFVGVTREFQEKPDWYERRNRVKALREPLRHGGGSVKAFRQNYSLPELPKIPGQQMTETGWHSEDCGYFDAIEAMDFYVHLEEAGEKV